MALSADVIRRRFTGDFLDLLVADNVKIYEGALIDLHVVGHQEIEEVSGEAPANHIGGKGHRSGLHFLVHGDGSLFGGPRSPAQSRGGRERISPRLSARRQAR